MRGATEPGVMPGDDSLSWKKKNWHENPEWSVTRFSCPELRKIGMRTRNGQWPGLVATYWRKLDMRTTEGW